MTAKPAHASPLLSIDEAAAYLGVSRRTVYRLSAERGAGGFPAPVAVSPGRRAFLRAELDAYIVDRAAHR